MATVGRFIAALRPARTVPALQRSLAQPLTKESSVYRQLPFLRRYGDAATKYTHEYYENLVRGKPVVVFMKGEPTAPMCGFSRLVVQILDMHGAKDYESHDVLEDVDFKEGMKEYS
ncbi:Glutaredoxin-related protein 5, mitochondrial [Geodia barretti]|uniref:Glutaredoxin-related protein 5, mitochondrial n=1 Tax=Geodia barretti TaxID=519541 RepID=A0AA35SWU9_GEOBA|nr:Glutaredoxin-related protein 5, mitochondrial [Geodia barretti]